MVPNENPEGRTGTGPLVVVSNRLPYDIAQLKATGRPRRNIGGLVNALEPVLAATGGTWVGWDGRILANLAAVESALRAPGGRAELNGIEYVGVPLSERELARYYHGYCNRALWPLFHDFIGKLFLGGGDFEFFERVNFRFAEVALAAAGEHGRIWVHDFHLMLVPGILRELGFEGRIDFFLHIPFPPPEIFLALPERRELFTSLLAADTVGFHVARYRENFLATAHALEIAHVLPSAPDFLVAHDNGTTSAMVAPVGVDLESFLALAADPAVRAKAGRIRTAHGGRRILFAADRLDYTKGIEARMAAIERLLSDNPALEGSFDLIQVVVPSRHQVEEYRRLKRDIDREVGRINGEHGGSGWMPIHYLYRALDREDLVAHYLAADVCLVTPLRDGLNLVAAEFAAARADDGDGVLICSEFAGIAGLLPGAIVVNPYDIGGMARSILDALAMPLAETAERARRLKRAVAALSASGWAAECLAHRGTRDPLRAEAAVLLEEESA